MCLNPGCCVFAEFLGVGFIEGSKEFEDGVGGSIAFGFAEASEFGFQVFGQVRIIGPNLFNKI